MASDEPGYVYITGTAGAGKTTFVQAYREWLTTAGYDATVVNLDPGNDAADYEPDVDIRDWVRLPEIMSEYGLGPNGAQVAAADMIALKIFEVKQALQEYRSDFVLLDTPGQIELFAFRESSKAIVEALGTDRAMIAFLVDPALARSPSGFVALVMLSATVEFRFRLPMALVLSKADILTPDQRTEILAWAEDPGRLYDRIRDDAPTPDVQLSTELFRALESMGPLLDLTPVSAREPSGLDQFYRTVQRILAGGEDPEPGQGPTDG
ncbi:MAG: ATP/GTP-binding protein [Thermoplasmata archaeon]